MSADDKARLERLTALARKIDETAEVDIGEEHGCVTYRPMRGVTGRMVNIDAWPRAADALEAALCVLAGEPSPAQDALHALVNAASTVVLELQHAAAVGFEGCEAKDELRALCEKHADKLYKILAQVREQTIGSSSMMAGGGEHG